MMLVAVAVRWLATVVVLGATAVASEELRKLQPGETETICVSPGENGISYLHVDPNGTANNFYYY